MIVGGCASLTVTVNVHVASGGVPFVAVQVTVVVPFGNANPEAGLHVTVGAGQPSPVGVVNVATAVQTSGSVFFVIFAGQALIVTALLIGVTSMFVSTGLKLVPVTWPWLLTEHTPAGNGLSTVTWNMIVTLSPAGIVPMFNVAVSPLNGAGVVATRRVLDA